MRWAGPDAGAVDRVDVIAVTVILVTVFVSGTRVCRSWAGAPLRTYLLRLFTVAGWPGPRRL